MSPSKKKEKEIEKNNYDQQKEKSQISDIQE